MDYQQAIESTITVKRAISELSKHGYDDDAFGVENGVLFCIDTNEHIARVNAGAVSGADVLNWLGY